MVVFPLRSHLLSGHCRSPLLPPISVAHRFKMFARFSAAVGGSGSGSGSSMEFDVSFPDDYTQLLMQAVEIREDLQIKDYLLEA